MGPGRKALLALVAVLLYLGIFVFSFVEAQVDTTPHELPIALAGPPMVAERAATALERRAPEAFEVRRLGGEAEARQAVRDREVYGALVLGGGQPVLYVAGASGSAATAAARGALSAVVRAAAGPPAVRDLVPLDRGDPRGLVFNFLVLPLVIVGIIAAAILRQAAPELGVRRRLALLAAFAVSGGLLTTLLAGPVLGALPGPFLAEAGIVALTIFAISAFSATLLELLGSPAIGLAFLVLLIVGNLGSGAGTPREFLPAFWRVLGPYLPPGAAAEALRDVAYFDGAEVVRPMLVLAAWAVVFAALAVLAGRRRPLAPRAEPAQG